VISSAETIPVKRMAGTNAKGWGVCHLWRVSTGYRHIGNYLYPQNPETKDSNGKNPYPDCRA
jgi:hypothetical protein